MSLAVLAKRLEKTVADNSPAILTGMAVVGTLTTAYLTGKATFKAAEIIDRDEFRGGTADDPVQRFKERFKLVWKLYIPAVTSATFTCTAIICANRIGTRRATALAAAYTISERAFDEYKEKVVEKLGQGKEREIRDEIAQERVEKAKNTEVFITGTGEVLFYDSITGRKFKSDMEAVRKAQNDLNAQLVNNVYASLGDFYDLIGLERTPYSEEVGWNTDRLMEIDFSTTLSDGVPCISIDYAVIPIRDYWGCP